jgi:sulfite exporter TauE/SafE
VSLLLILTGLFAGAYHVFTGPDHLAAVAPLSLTRQGRSWLVGLRWGLGHSSGVIIVGIVAYYFRDVIMNSSAFTWSERLVGLTLIGIGLWGLRRSLKTRVHTHEHVHSGEAHQHPHVHAPANAHEPPKAKAHFHTHTALFVGILHGLGGGSHLLGVIPTLGMPTRLAAATYLLSFGIGTIVAMMSFSTVMDLIASRSSTHGMRAYRLVTLSFSIAAIGIGCYWFCVA